MPWVHFTKKFDFSPRTRPGVTIAYQAGRSYNVTRACAEEAISAGAGKKTVRPKTESEPAAEASSNE